MESPLSLKKPRDVHPGKHPSSFQKIYFAPINPDLSAYRKSWRFAKDSPWVGADHTYDDNDGGGGGSGGGGGYGDYGDDGDDDNDDKLMKNVPDSHSIETSGQWLRSPLYNRSKKVTTQLLNI